MDDSEIIDQAAEVFIRNAIINAADETIIYLQELLGISNRPFCPGTSSACNLLEHLDLLVKDYCAMFSEHRQAARM